MRDLEKKNELLKNNLKILKKEYEDYKNSVIERMEDNMQQEMETINKEIEDYESKIAFQGYNFDFKVRDKKGNQVFERRVIYELKR
jgi:gas vesicle protein